MREPANTVFNNHHRTIDDDAEVQRAQTHQIGADLVLNHASKGEQHGQRNNGSGNDRGAQISQKNEQHDNHQNRTFEQIFLDGGDRLVDQDGSVIHRHRANAVGKIAINFLHLQINRLRYGTAVLTHQHEHGTKHDFLAIGRCRTGTQFLTDAHFSHIPHAHRNATGILDDDIANVVQSKHLPRCSHQILLTPLLDITCASIVIILINGSDQIFHRHAQ